MYNHLIEGTENDVAFRSDGTLEKFLRLKYFDLVDDHKWSYPLTIAAHVDEKLKFPALMVLFDGHDIADLLPFYAAPPELPGIGDIAGLENHFQFTDEHLLCTSHVAPLCYSGAVDEIIVVKYLANKQGVLEYHIGETTEEFDDYRELGERRDGFGMSILPSEIQCDKKVRVTVTDFLGYPYVLQDRSFNLLNIELGSFRQSWELGRHPSKSPLTSWQP